MDKYMTLKEVVEGFVNFAYGDILFENEVSRFNISFEDSSFLKNKEFNFFSNSLQDILNNVPNCEIPTVVIHDTELFFRLLTNVINAQIDLNDLYDNSAAKSMVARRVMRRLWLRMGVEELDNIELFLEKQLAFIENRELDKPNEEIVIDDNPRITLEIQKSETWCEASRRACFRIYEGDLYHELPRVYYDIREENGELVCYIPAVQMVSEPHKVKSVERKLYKLNKGLEDTLVHPNFMMAIKLFYSFLYKRGINHIKVPLMQVLDYDYHIALAKTTEIRMKDKWSEDVLSYIEKAKNIDLEAYEQLMKEFESDKKKLEHLLGREDFISKAKTEGLINLFYQATFITDSVINTEPFVNASYLDISLGKLDDNELKK